VGSAVAPAAAQGQTVTASDYRFSPGALPIAVGQTVTFTNSGGLHNVVFEDGPRFPDMPAFPSDPVWAAGPSRTFTIAGTYRYVCAAHEANGMTGTITVQAPGSPPSNPPPTNPPPPPPPGGAPPPPAAGGTPALEVRTLRTDGRTFCTKRGPRCPRPGVRVRIDLSVATPVGGTLTRRARRFGRVSFGTVAAGPRTLRFTRTSSGRRLTPGRYALALRIGTARQTLRFRVL
jgi:plastocyanin